jgi:hypothetical protein
LVRQDSSDGGGGLKFFETRHLLVVLPPGFSYSQKPRNSYQTGFSLSLVLRNTIVPVFARGNCRQGGGKASPFDFYAICVYNDAI